MFKKITAGFGGAVALVLVMQAVPYGRAHTNPPVVREPAWNSPETRTLAKRACFDCHSHETVWLWYSRIAPISWLVQYDVDKGRSELNFSAWNGGKKEEQPTKMANEIRKGEMPPLQYTIIHPEARLSETEKETLIQGLTATAGR
ncbi:MAG TPA: heme-binding domain-containing protein [Desulfuromonadales bacterium]|nr:heme-binding domain-containing protein [Desulfuromonadales bacterium]